MLSSQLNCFAVNNSNRSLCYLYNKGDYNDMNVELSNVILTKSGGVNHDWGVSKSAVTKCIQKLTPIYDLTCAIDQKSNT